MTFNEAKLRTKLGMKVKLPEWHTMKYISAFHHDNTITFYSLQLGETTGIIPSNWLRRTDWEIHHEI